MGRAPTAADIIARLELKPHPEGGHFRETFRDARLDANGRAVSTAIYFLLARGERSHWHRIDAVEVWHFYAGSPLTLQIADGDGRAHHSCSAPILPPAKCRRRSCPRRHGRPPKAAATGRWPDARSRPDSISRNLNWRRKAGRLRRVGKAKRAHQSASQCRFMMVGTAQERLCPPYFFPIISFAAINPPPAISTAATAIAALGFAKPAMIRNAVESSGVA